MDLASINKEKIETYQSQFYAALDDYKNAQIFYKLKPDNEQYHRNYIASDTMLTSINKDLFVITNDIQSNVDNLNSRINELNEKISEERGQWEYLGFNYQQVKGKGEGANVMIDNAKELYKKQYISNWLIFIGIFIFSLAIYRVFGKNSANQINNIAPPSK